MAALELKAKDYLDELSKYFSKTDLAGLSKEQLEGLLEQISGASEAESQYLQEIITQRKDTLVNTLLEAGIKASREELNSFVDAVTNSGLNFYRNDPNMAARVNDIWQSNVSPGNSKGAWSYWQDFLKQKDLPNDASYYLGQRDLTIPKFDEYSDVINSRLRSIEEEKALDQYLGEELPNSLTKRREEFFGGESARARELFQTEIVPLTREDANIRGLFDSGYVPTALTARAADIQAELDQLAATSAAEDFSYLADAAYRNKVRKLLEGQTDYRSALMSERNNQLLEQQYRFQTSQSDLDRRFRENAERQNYELQAKQQEEALKRQARESRNQSRGQLFGQIGTAAGGIIGGIYGGPAGAAGGAAAGGAVGNQLGGSVKG